MSDKKGKAENANDRAKESSGSRSEVLVSIKRKEEDAAKAYEEEKAESERRIAAAKSKAEALIEDAKKAAEEMLDKASAAAEKEAAAKGSVILKKAQSDAKKVGKVGKEGALDVFASVVRKRFNIGADDA